DPVVHLVPVRGHLRRPGRVRARDDRRADDVEPPRVDAVDDLRHAGDELVGIDLPAGEVVRAFEEDHLTDPRALEHVAIEALDRSWAALPHGDGDAVAADAFVDEPEILI